MARSISKNNENVKHQKWLEKRGVSKKQIKAKKAVLGNPNSLPSYREELRESERIKNLAATSDQIPQNGTKNHQEAMFKEKESLKYPTMPAYNKGPVMVVSKSELPYAGKKI